MRSFPETDIDPNLAYLGKFSNHICISENTNILDLLLAFTSDHVNTTFHCNYVAWTKMNLTLNQE